MSAISFLSVSFRNSSTGFHVCKLLEITSSVSGLSPRTCKQPDDKTEGREHKDEYDPENLRACGNRALKDIDYSPYVKYKDKQSKKTAESEHINPPLEFKNIASSVKSQLFQSEEAGKRGSSKERKCESNSHFHSSCLLTTVYCLLSISPKHRVLM